MSFTDKQGLILRRPKISKLYSVNVSGVEIDVPAVYGKVSATMSFFPASYTKVEQLIGNKRIFPMKIFPGVAILAVTVFDYMDAPVGPYREIALSVPSTIDKKIPILPLLFDSLFSNFGFYTLLLIMNTDLGIQHSKDVFGYPTFNKKVTIDIENDKSFVKINAYSAEEQIFSMKMEGFKTYHPMQDKKYNTFFANNNELHKVEMVVDAYVAERNLGAKNNEYNFGNHEISNTYFKNLMLSDKPLKHMHYRQATEVLSQPYKI
ncbi:MAG: hypothetical protein Q7S11_01810 [bacterium]|nr:hypothetical protein [bacterium]